MASDTAPLRGSLLEREHEVASLAAAVQATAAGEPQIVVVEGAAGIGKSRLMGEARGLALAAGVRVLAARGSQMERDFPFGVVRQLIEPAVRGDGARALTGTAAPARDVFNAISDAGTASGDRSFAFLHGLYWLTVNLTAGKPSMLMVDDLQWCDTPSLRFLAYLARRLDELPVMMTCSLRSASREASPALVAELHGDPRAVTIRPRPLSAVATERLVHERLGAPPAAEFAAACHAATGGNPLLLHELLMTLHADGIVPDERHVASIADVGPRAALRTVLVRLARLPEPSVRLARALAVLGDGTNASLVAAVAGVGDDDAGRGLAALIRAEILEPEPPLRFVHQLVGAAVHHDITAIDRTMLHRRAADVLRETDAPPAQTAVHLLMVPPAGDPWAVGTLVEAARGSLAKGSADGAIAYLERALAEPPSPEQRADVLLDLGRAETRANGPAAIAHLAEAYELHGDPVARGTAATLLGRALLFTGDVAGGAALARRAREELPPELAEVKDQLDAFELMAVFLGAGDPEELRRLEPHRRLPVPDGVGAKMLAAVAAQEWAYSGGPSDLCAELSLQALAGGELIRADNGFMGVIAITTLTLADHEEARDAWEVSLADAHQRGSLFDKCSVDLWRGFTMLRRGELAEAEALLRIAREELEQWGIGSDQGVSHCDAHLAAVLRERGDVTAARAALERSGDSGDAAEGTRYWLHGLLEQLLCEARYGEAAEVADELAERFGFLRHPLDTSWRTGKALALAQLGRIDEALTLAEEELELARCWGAPGTVARALRVSATLDRRNALALLDEAVAVVARSPARLEHAKAVGALGGALRAAGRAAKARDVLRDALDVATACQAQGLARVVRTELHAAGGRPRAAARTGVSSLTASERRVAGLAASGLANRDIAEALFVTTKTVELHLSNAYRKLGIRSRAALPRDFADDP